MWETHIPVCGVKEAKKGFECRCSVTEVNALISSFRTAGSHFHILPPPRKTMWVLWFFLMQWENRLCHRKTCPVLHIMLMFHKQLWWFVLIYRALYGEKLFIFKPTQSQLGSEEYPERASAVETSGPNDSLNLRVSIWWSQWNVQTIIVHIVGRQNELLGFWKSRMQRFICCCCAHICL